VEKIALISLGKREGEVKKKKKNDFSKGDCSRRGGAWAPGLGNERRVPPFQNSQKGRPVEKKEKKVSFRGGEGRHGARRGFVPPGKRLRKGGFSKGTRDRYVRQEKEGKKKAAGKKHAKKKKKGARM